MARRLLNASVLKLLKTTGSRFHMGDGTFITEGMKFKADDGEMVILIVNYEAVTYLQNNGVYYEDADSFAGRKFDAVIRGAINAYGQLYILELEACIVIGMMAGYAPWWVGITCGAAQWVYDNRTHLDTYVKLLTTIWEVRSILLSCAPTLYKIMIQGVLFNFYEEIGMHLPESMYGYPKEIANAIGQLLGKLGNSAVQKKLSLFGALWAILFGVVMFGVKKIPNATIATAKDYKQAATDFIEGCRKLGVVVTKTDADSIFSELATNGSLIYDALDKINSCVKQLP